MARQAVFFVSVGGVDVTGNLTPWLISIRVHDGAGQASDTAEIVLDDSGGHIAYPAKGDPMVIMLGWSDGGLTVVFEGKIDNVESEGARGGGLLLTISAKSADTESKVKEGREKHWDDKSLGDVLREAGQHAGVAVSVHPQLSALKRDYWSMGNQSFAAFGQALARDLGATFKIRGNRAAFVPRNAGLSATGAALPPITVRFGEGGNGLSWRITPASGRPQFKKFTTRWFDVKAGKWMRERIEAQADSPAESTDRYSEADADTASHRSGSARAGGEREKGGGTAVIDGDPTAQAEAPVTISGARPGVDGAYVADSVEHNYTRGGGYVTTIEVKHPGGEAGTDGRK